jgi:hypothetical protein
MGILSSLNPATAIANALGGTILDGVNTGIKSIWGSKQERDQQSYELNAANQSEYSAEFQFRENRSWWDSFIDGLNRLPRPVMALGVIALFVWCPIDTVGFSQAMVALGLIPQPMWLVLGTIIAFFFGDRTIKGIQDMKAPSATQVRQVIDAQKAIRDAALQAPGADGAAARVDPEALKGVSVQSSRPAESDQAYRADMADASSPLSNATILEWNRRQKQGARP